MIYKTETGSVYQVDPEGKRVRRLTGESEPTPRQGKDGQWKDFINYDKGETTPGCLFFIWEIIDGVAKGTTTSRVVEVIEEN